MRRKDDLLRLAFGELNEADARALEVRADASERAEIEAFRKLHEGLRHFPPPPADGLSAERLRAAILDREIQARRPTFAWSSAFLAPLALAALAAVVLVPRLRPHAVPQIVARNDANPDRSSKLDFRPLERSRASEAVLSPSAVSSAPGLSTPRAKTPEDVSPRHSRRRHADPVEEPQIDTSLMMVKTVDSTQEEGMPPKATLVAKREPDTIATIVAPAAAVVEAAPGASKTETVVIVSTKRDLETGASAATEKEASGVLVGG